MSSKSLVERGFAHYFPEVDLSRPEIDVLKNEFRFLEPDPYASGGLGRFRRYGRGMIAHWLSDYDMLIWFPPMRNGGFEFSMYDQGNNNLEHAHPRFFRSISQRARQSDALRRLIVNDFRLSSIKVDNSSDPIHFGVHFVKLLARLGDDDGVSSPNCFHQDGEPFTFVHLIYRSPGAVGGINFVANPSACGRQPDGLAPDELLGSFCLEQFLESFAVCDAKVSHYVSPLSARSLEESVAERDVILVDFSLMRNVV
jgi:hypothetical protein